MDNNNLKQYYGKINENFLKDLIFENISNTSNKIKVRDDEFKIIKMNNYNIFKTHQFKVSQLKEICEYYKLKKLGNKNELINKIYNFLKYSLYAIKIQKCIRGILLRKFILFGGKAFNKRELCVNDTDFGTLDSIKEIPYNQFFSFNQGECIYGCDIISFNSLLYKKNNIQKETINPYNREKIPDETINQFKQYLKFAKINKIEQIKEDVEEEIDPKKKMELKIVELFQYINELGNYSDSKWLTSLSLHMLVMYIRELYDIWNYRAQLTPSMMREIVPPHGNPFIGLQMNLQQNQNEESLRKSAIRIIEYMVKSGDNVGNRSLGAYYVLSGLTLVSEDARIALPWLYESVQHNIIN